MKFTPWTDLFFWQVVVFVVLGSYLCATGGTH